MIRAGLSARKGNLRVRGKGTTVRDLPIHPQLRTDLQTWLDENLPAIVERLVREEIARVVGEAGLR